MAIAFRVAAPFAVGTAPVALAVGNFNANANPPDSNSDLIVADSAASTIRWLQGKGTGAFNVRPTIAVGAQPAGVAVSDFDGDGNLDVATANAGDGTVSVCLGHGDGTFEPPVSTAVGTEPSALVAIGSLLAVTDASSSSLPVSRPRETR